MNAIYLIRHCKAAGQEPDAELTAEGKAQAQQLALMLAGLPIVRVVTSPYRRAVDTIAPFCRSAGVPYATDGRLTERVLSAREMPDWMDKLRLTFADPELKYEGGESSREAAARGLAVVRELAAGSAAGSAPDGCAAVVTHGALMSHMLDHFCGGRFGYEGWRSLSNPDVYRIDPAVSGSGAERIWPGR